MILGQFLTIEQVHKKSPSLNLSGICILMQRSSLDDTTFGILDGVLNNKCIGVNDIYLLDQIGHFQSGDSTKNNPFVLMRWRNISEPKLSLVNGYPAAQLLPNHFFNLN